MHSDAKAKITEAWPDTRQVIGELIEIRGADAQLGLHTERGSGNDRVATVGSFLGIDTGRSVTVAMVTEVCRDTSESQGGNMPVRVSVDLVGEILTTPDGVQAFQRGVTIYPTVGDQVTTVTEAHARKIYGSRVGDTITIGQTQQAAEVDAKVNADEMLQKHFAIFGTTGVGKSSGVAVVLHELMKARPDLRIFLMDAHNEYGRCFGARAQTLTPANLRLPFWMFNNEEIVDVFYRGRPGPDEEIDILFDVIPAAKRLYWQQPTGERSDQFVSDPGFSIDTPVPYRLSDLLALIDERMGKLENRSSRIVYKKLMQRINSVVNDPRYAFMFAAANVGGDTMSEVLGQLFRLQHSETQMTVMQLAGFPAEVVDSVVSVVCRLAFDFGLWSDGALPLLVVCEEAHRYASANRDIGFGPTRRAISRIAKEGRKYGVYLGLVSQRPAELDSTIISQCSTLFVMRLANERDQAIVRSAVADNAASLHSFIPSLGTREVLAFGEGVPIPTRLRFKKLPPASLPKSEAVGSIGAHAGGVTEAFIDDVLDRWRGAMVTNRPMNGNEGETIATPNRRPLDPTRYRILKRQAGE